MNGANDAGGVDLAGAMGNLNLNTPPPPRCGTCPNRTFTDAHALSQHCAATGHPPLHGEGPNSVMRTFCIQCPTRVFLTRAAAQSHATARDHTIEDRPVSRRERAIDDFFAQFPSFPYRPELPYFRQFNTLASEMGWGRRNPHRNEFRLAMAEAFGSDFNASTDEEAERLEVWQNLYRAVAENPDDVPEDIAGCKEVINNSFINLVDLHEYKRNPETTPRPTRFPTRHKLVEYTMETGRVFPKATAYSQGLLKWLLREIFGTYHGFRGRSRRRPSSSAGSEM